MKDFDDIFKDIDWNDVIFSEKPAKNMQPQQQVYAESVDEDFDYDDFDD